jgi:hypothetical protein
MENPRIGIGIGIVDPVKVQCEFIKQQGRCRCRLGYRFRTWQMTAPFFFPGFAAELACAWIPAGVYPVLDTGRE